MTYYTTIKKELNLCVPIQKHIHDLLITDKINGKTMCIV